MNILEKFSHIQTKHIILSEIDESDLGGILLLRTGRKDNHLHPVGVSIDDQLVYYREYLRRRTDNDEFYYKILLPASKEPVGFVRLTQLNSKLKFSYESMIVREGVSPHVSLDTILTIYRLGFDLLSKEYCGPWAVKNGAEKILKLHLTMRMATVVGSDDHFTHFVVHRTKYLRRMVDYHKMGLGNVFEGNSKGG